MDKPREEPSENRPGGLADARKLQGDGVQTLRELFGLDTTSSQCLILALRSHPLIGIVPEPPRGALVWGDRAYTEKPWGEFTGFYDWLISEHHQVLGIRYSPFSELSSVIEAFRKVPYIEVDGSALTIWFCDPDDRDHAPPQSIDQDFGSNRLFTDSSGEWLITFNASFMRDEALDALWLLNADWIDEPFLRSAPR